jgi:hypothetical protein
MFENFHFLFPILAHGGGEEASMTELLFSVGLLVLSGGLAAALFLGIFIKPILRVRRQWKEGKLPSSNKSIYLIASAAIVIGFVWIVYQFAMAVYYDYHFQEYEQRERASGSHAPGGAEYKWKRWHINGRYAPNQLSLLVDDVLRSADPGQELSVQARKLSPTAGDWQPMKWVAEKKMFVAPFPPEGEKMEFEFEVSSGLSSYRDIVISYVPRRPPAGAITPPEHHEGDGHNH